MSASMSRMGGAAAVSLVLATLAGCGQKKTLVPFVFPQTPTQVVTGPTQIFYSVEDVQGQAVQVNFEISKDNGRTYVNMTPAGNQPALPLVFANPYGTPSSFFWDSFADIGPGVYTSCIIRTTGFANGETGKQSITLPFLANESGSFTATQTPQGTPRSNDFAGPLPNGSVILAGGLEEGTPTTLVEVYDPVGEQVFPVTNLSVARTNLAGALLSSGVVLLAGGADVNSNALAAVDLFSPVTNAAVAVPSGLGVARFDAGLAAVGSGQAVIAGGVGPGGALVPTVELYDPAAGPQGAVAPIATATFTAVRLPTATTLLDGRVLFTGGSDATGNAVATTFIFDPATSTVAAGPSMAFARVGHRATRLSTGKVLVTGGETQFGVAATSQISAEVFDPTANAFSAAGGMSHGRAFHGQDLAGGRVVAAAGTGPAGDVSTTADVYDQDANAWTTLSFNTTAEHTDATLVTSGPGRALLAGGNSPPEIYFPLDAILTFVPDLLFPPPPYFPLFPTQQLPPGTNPGLVQPPLNPPAYPTVEEAWIALRTTARARAFHTATRLTTGDVLLAGGITGIASATNSVELFQVSQIGPQDTVTTRAALLTARSHHGAALAFAGVVVAGGLDVNGNVLGSLESYNLVADSWTAIPSPLTFPRYDHHVVALGNGDVLIVGGRDATGAPVGQAELYHPTFGTTEVVGSEITPRVDDDVLPLESGGILISGGQDVNGNAVLTNELYDTVSESFIAADTLLAGRIGGALSLSASFSEVMITGGESTPGVARADFEGIYCATLDLIPVAPSPNALGPLDTARAFHLAQSYSDLTVLLEGGTDGTHVLDSSTIYFPTGSLFFTPPTALEAYVRQTITPRMNMPRQWFTATPLVDGRVLVAGGVDQRGVVIPGLETFNR
jgi:hypothetical protein